MITPKLHNQSAMAVLKDGSSSMKGCMYVFKRYSLLKRICFLHCSIGWYRRSMKNKNGLYQLSYNHYCLIQTFFTITTVKWLVLVYSLASKGWIVSGLETCKDRIPQIKLHASSKYIMVTNYLSANWILLQKNLHTSIQEQHLMRTFRVTQYNLGAGLPRVSSYLFQT